jgi:imidazolonepropionase-like amidohydrolase
MSRSSAARSAAALVIAAGLFPAQASARQGTWALTNARIETVTRGVIERGTIVIRDGLIAAVGANVQVPADARVIDLSGRRVVPGLIDLTSTIGLPAPPQPGGGGGPGGGGFAAAQAAAQQGQRGPVGLEPARMVADELRPTAADVRAAREAGITAALVAPTRGAFRGQSALVPMREDAETRDVVRSPVGLHLGFQGAQGRYPATLLGVMAYQRQAFHDARRHGILLERYQQNPRGMERPPNDPDLAALVPVVRGQLPAFFAASSENEIVRALGIGSEFGLNLTIVGATEGFRALDALRAARRPVVVSVDFPRPTQVTGWQYRGAQRRPANDSVVTDSLVRQLVEGNAAALSRGGVRFALASGGLRPAEFLGNVRRAIAAGLPRDSALAALTIRAAEIAGAAQQLGSIEEGKVANLVVTEGDILSDSARVRWVFVDGRGFEVEARPAAAAGRGGQRGAGGGAPAGRAGDEVAQVGGTWDITISTPQGDQQVTLTAAQSGSTFTGSMTSQMGSMPIEGGQVEGRRVAWSMMLTMGGQSMTVNYSGEVDGNRISGTAALGEFGSFSFRGEKRP